MAILSSVSERNTAIDRVLAENDPEPKQPVCFNAVGQRLYVRRNRVGDISWYYNCVLMPNDLRKGVIVMV